MRRNQFIIVGDSEMLDEEQQKILLNFLLNILKDTRSIRVECDCTHQDLYLQMVDLMKDLKIFSIKEDYNVDLPLTWKVDLEFLYPLRNLLNVRWENE